MRQFMVCALVPKIGHLFLPLIGAIGGLMRMLPRPSGAGLWIAVEEAIHPCGCPTIEPESTIHAPVIVDESTVTLVRCGVNLTNQVLTLICVILPWDAAGNYLACSCSNRYTQPEQSDASAFVSVHCSFHCIYSVCAPSPTI